MTGGLSSAEAARRLAEFGPNEPVRVRRMSALRQLAALFANPLVAILLAASAISAALGRLPDAAIIATMMLLGSRSTSGRPGRRSARPGRCGRW